MRPGFRCKREYCRELREGHNPEKLYTGGEFNGQTESEELELVKNGCKRKRSTPSRNVLLLRLLFAYLQPNAQYEIVSPVSCFHALRIVF